MDIKDLAVSERLICALDTADVDEVKAIIDELDGVVSFFKIGITLHLASGLEIVNLLLDSGKRVFLDLKYYDISETVEQAVRQAAQLGVTFLTVHGNSEIIRGAVRGKGDSDLQILLVTVLTSLDQEDLSEMGYPVPLEDLVLTRAKNGLKYGANGVISSAHEAGIIKEETEGKLLVISPGIRDEDAPSDDQKRKMSADAAIKAGADFLVVGRPITAPQDGKTRREAAQSIIEKMKQGFADTQ
ncbi:MAG: orotidine-5'-phosphate decarboxylase [Coriobacteriia bacterium]|nr:orotidine-5'-phosphate decarboxylase [Coriobacteriia bacterium]